MECKTDKRKKRAYQRKLWAAALAVTFAFAVGCVIMIKGLVPEAVSGLMAILLAVLIGCFFPAYILLIRGLTLSGTQRVFLRDDTLWYINWEGDNGEAGARFHFFKIWKVSEYTVKKDTIEVKAFVWYSSDKRKREELTAEEGRWIPPENFEEKAERCQRSITICRIFEEEEEILRVLEKRKQALPVHEGEERLYKRGL